MILRRELPGDAAAIRSVHSAAFTAGVGGVVVEAPLVDALRIAGDVVAALSVVAEHEGVVVGHVVCSRGQIDTSPSLGLGPIGVLPEFQGRGVGGALMHAVIAAADAVDEPAILLLGDPLFYRRFGFEPASAKGVTSPNPLWEDYFQIRTLTSWTPDHAGAFEYATAFADL